MIALDTLPASVRRPEARAHASRRVEGALALWVAFAAFPACTHGGSGDAALTRAERARLALARGQPGDAAPLLEALHAEAPGDLAVARELCEAFVQLGQAEPFAARLNAALRAPGGDTAANHFMLGLTLFARSADAAGPAVAELERAIELSPREPELHYRLGLALLESERFERALGPLQKAIELAPARSAIALPLAKAQYRTGDSTAAVASLRRVVSANPTPAEVATARALMGQIADPFVRLPRAARSRLEQGLEWLSQRDVPQQAIIVFEELLRDYPDLAVAHALLGLAYQRVDDAGRAVDELKRAIELAPDDGQNHLYLGQLYLGRQRTGPGEAELAAALALNPVLDDAHAKLGDLALDRGDLPGAREHFRAWVTLQPASTDARGKLALALAAAGDYAAADRELKVVVDREPDNLEAKLRLGLLHADRQAHARAPEERKAAGVEAARWLSEVLKGQPDNAAASRALEGLARE